MLYNHETITLDDIMNRCQIYLRKTVESKKSLYLTDDDGFKYFFDKNKQTVYIEDPQMGWRLIDVVEKVEGKRFLNMIDVEKLKLKLKKLKWKFDN